MSHCHHALSADAKIKYYGIKKKSTGKRTETHLFAEIMQSVTAIHSWMSGNFKQFCSLVWVHLDLLVVFFPSLADVNNEIYDLVGENDILGLNIFTIKSN